jgi:hypothetical protein
MGRATGRAVTPAGDSREYGTKLMNLRDLPALSV